VYHYSNFYVNFAGTFWWKPVWE